MDKHSDKARRGERAEALLSDPLMKEAFETLEETYIETWKAADTVEARENTHRLMASLITLKAHLTSVALTGALSRTQKRELRRGGRW